ncbi:YfhJ family protein [Saliterribacillus persicus]|uniref:WVELL protein n=1 Tax=Saliterribacillus persicus TaxID=930114 RepID=A0A368X8T1_9BACI|nr:YfhJ family protein [Saliterribacillus persicus]RCW62837.1 WVELL protein [Saliterribacillus persicus]
MQQSIKRLAEQLYSANPMLSPDEAEAWVTLLWEDFEATSAKAGREYLGPHTTERIVKYWIANYGPRLNEFAENYPRYKKMLDGKDPTLH